MPTALVTGITGQDGSYLCERLVADGWTVVGLVRDTAATDEQPVTPGVSTVVGDLSDLTGLRDLVLDRRPDLVVNLAGITSVARSWEEPVETLQVSGVAVAAILDAATRLTADGHPVRVIQASSAEVFAGSGDDPITESSRVAPVSPYGLAKATAHLAVAVSRGRGVHASAAILFNHESTRRAPSFVSRKITAGVAAIATGRADSLTLGNLDASRDWGWAPDHVDAIVRMAAADEPGDFVIATGETHTVAEFAAEAFRAAGIEDVDRYLRTDASLLRPTDAAVLRGDSTRARRELGWAPTHDFHAVVAAMVAHDLALAGAAG